MLYPKWKQALVQASANSALTGTLKVALIDTGTYTYSATHEFLTDLTGIVGTPQTITTKTYTDGVLNGDDVTFTAVTGNTVEAYVVYIDTGVAATSRLVSYVDSGVGSLPVTPNGGDIDINWNASGIFAL